MDHNDISFSGTNLQSIFAKSSGIRSSGTDSKMAVLGPGSCDFLRIAEEPPAPSRGAAASPAEKSAARQTYERWNIVRDYLISQGDRVVHFSGEATEMINSLPVKRFVIVTENGLYRVAQSTIDTGIFFDCRTNLDHLAQMIALDATQEGHGFGGAEVQVYLKNKKAPGSVDLAYTLNFAADMARRKSFLLSICVVRPTLPILQKRRLETADSSVDVKGQSSHRKRGQSINTPSYMKPTSSSKKHDPATEHVPNSPTPGKPTSPGRELHYSPATFRSRSGDHLPHHSAARAARQPTPDEEHKEIMEISQEDFNEAKLLLREQLSSSEAQHTGGYDAAAVVKRPPEEDLSRTMERERVKAMLISREAKIVQNIEFKLKYPQKVPTRVTHGVEYDKAHEERRVPPDDFNDSELLGPSLHPLWVQWKESGGLLGYEGMPSSEWTMYDTNDLIDSLRAREDVLYGVIGKRSMRRLIQMRELVEREKQMFINKQNMILGSGTPRGTDADGITPRGPHSGDEASQIRSRQATSTQRGRVHSGKMTKVRPFHLSTSPMANRKLRIIDSAELLSEMKHNFEKHLKTLHQLRKEQLQREVTRAKEI